ncbi:delta(12) fatty acid desaturase FAD2-like [Haliotis rubra]|uniref:delta(12) fatty acid desaturase FAD2-like n=1 Tax=Haliotis rubra TaxID=36100 RepID=UPI001EE54B49|nr:delta(12) fatty acid desaturase FAD2-like [Haliotis rubra]
MKMGEPKKGDGSWWQILLNVFLVTLVTEEKAETPEDGIADADDDHSDPLSKVRLPRKLPSIVDIKRKLPVYCFDPKVSTSMYYAFKDVVLIAALYVLGELMWNYLPLIPFLALTPVLWFAQGTLFTAVFVVGHDCGHGSFSHHVLLNDVVGTVFHTFLLAPYYTWKVSHKHHHKNTGNIDKDEVFYPVRKSDSRGEVTLPWFGLGVGWFGYLIRGYKPRQVCHFNPLQPIFSKHVLACIVTLVAMAVWCSCLYSYAMAFGFWKLFYHYIVPDLIFATLIVMITFLHHTEDEIPWYSDHLWSNVRGQLSSVDRHYGLIHDAIHNIGTHQIHHLFPKIPHYRLEEATSHFRKEFPDLVKSHDEGIMPAFVRMFKKYVKQSVISDDTEVHLYK